MFKNLDGYRGEGSFEGWFRRIVVNEGIEHYRKEKNGRILIEMDAIPEGEKPFVEWDGLEAKDLLQVIRELPEGYRMVFNLFAIEGYSHKEIGEMLSISENTSKSQLSRARQVLKQKLTHM